MPTPSNVGGDYSRFFTPVPGETVPFPNPQNDAQRQANARARAARAGTTIGSGYLNPRSGELEDPNHEPWYANPAIMGPIILGATTAGLGAFGGPFSAVAGGAASGSAGTAGVIPGTGIPTVFGAGGAAALPTAPLGGVAAGAGAAAGASRGLNAIKKSLTDPTTYAALAPLLASLAMNSGGGAGGGGGVAGMDELRRIQGITEARMRRTDPLHQVATQLAYSRAPIDARKGIDLTNVPLP